MQSQDSTVQVMGIDAGGTMTDTFFVRADGHETAEERSFSGGPSPAALIEIADLKERIRKLEAIAAGVDL
jgi:N-methylhydantoinase A/oxoprolinase/acetone carboxylase beta subunit